MCYRWDSTDGRRIMISNDHNTHIYRSACSLSNKLSYSSGVAWVVASAGAGAASAASAASSAASARVAATLATPSLGSVISLTFAGSLISSARSEEHTSELQS